MKRMKKGPAHFPAPKQNRDESLKTAEPNAAREKEATKSLVADEASACTSEGNRDRKKIARK